MESTILDTKQSQSETAEQTPRLPEVREPSLSEKLKAEIDAVVAEAVSEKAEIEEQIKTLTGQLEQNRENLGLADAKVDEFDDQRQNLISSGKPTDSIYKEFDAALIARNRLRDEIEAIEEKALPKKYKKLDDYKDRISSAAHTALSKQREVVVVLLQDSHRKQENIFSEWTDLCTKLQVQYGVNFLKRSMNPFMAIVMSDKCRNALNERAQRPIAKLRYQVKGDF